MRSAWISNQIWWCYHTHIYTHGAAIGLHNKNVERLDIVKLMSIFNYSFVESNIICLKSFVSVCGLSTAVESYEHFVSLSHGQLIQTVDTEHLDDVHCECTPFQMWWFSFVFFFRSSFFFSFIFIFIHISHNKFYGFELVLNLSRSVKLRGKFVCFILFSVDWLRNTNRSSFLISHE